MSEWIAGGESGTYALVADAAERDAYLRSGDWVLAEEPRDSDWVFIWHEGATTPGRYPLSALRELWGPRGYVAGPPPGGSHPLIAEPPAEAPAEPESDQPAAGGTEKGK